MLPASSLSATRGRSTRLGRSDHSGPGRRRSCGSRRRCLTRTAAASHAPARAACCAPPLLPRHTARIAPDTPSRPLRVPAAPRMRRTQLSHVLLPPAARHLREEAGPRVAPLSTPRSLPCLLSKPSRLRSGRCRLPPCASGTPRCQFSRSASQVRALPPAPPSPLSPTLTSGGSRALPPDAAHRGKAVLARLLACTITLPSGWSCLTTRRHRTRQLGLILESVHVPLDGWTACR